MYQFDNKFAVSPSNFGKKYYLEFYKVENNGFVRNFIFESRKFEWIKNYDWRFKKKN